MDDFLEPQLNLKENYKNCEEIQQDKLLVFQRVATFYYVSNDRFKCSKLPSPIAMRWFLAKKKVFAKSRKHSN